MTCWPAPQQVVAVAQAAEWAAPEAEAWAAAAEEEEEEEEGVACLDRLVS